MESITSVLGKGFAGTVIEDPVLEPFFIMNSGGNAYAVSKKRLDKSGVLRYSDIAYPSSFEGCLLRIANEKLNEEGKVFNSLRDYVEKWREVSSNILNACKKLGVEKF